MVVLDSEAKGLKECLKQALSIESAPRRHLAPPQDIFSLCNARGSGVAKTWRELGQSAIKEGKVAVITMAGGQGTRLGSSLPKGCFDVGLPSGKSLFKLQAERLIRIGLGCIPWLIMTSPATHKDTVSFFDDNKMFGYKQDQIVFFQQDTLPALTEQGDIIRDEQGGRCLSPNGNGGIFRALQVSGCMDWLRSVKIEHVHVLSVDNVLAKPADPTFIGFCIDQGVEVGSKCVLKRNVDEKTGVFAEHDGKLIIAEYTELPQEAAMFKDANISSHYFTLKFLEKCAEIHLPNHIARKAIKIGRDESVQGIKLEKFIFDSLQFAGKSAVLRVEREEEFAPLKNASGEDSPETCKNAVLALHKSWGNQGEVSPLDSYDGEI